MTPILAGLVIVSFVLPVLIHLKLPGLEASLQQSTESVSSGPMGDVGFGQIELTVSSGPQGARTEVR
jgi:hypothetical protein